MEKPEEHLSLKELAWIFSTADAARQKEGIEKVSGAVSQLRAKGKNWGDGTTARLSSSYFNRNVAVITRDELNIYQPIGETLKISLSDKEAIQKWRAAVPKEVQERMLVLIDDDSNHFSVAIPDSPPASFPDYNG